ncbi:hypothetical protein DPMN_035105 [Dreissena polymorpha]|uniref:Uncharacterized protein n=1 Tax=Dreissena polymorpha TaxID=45954 RepID=A0A9D4RMN3_DREPO|nr:hypothetical protein DPMN_035105 [Dreissena polymorpha]
MWPLETRKNAPPPGGHILLAPPLGSHTDLLTKFHENWTINVTSRVLKMKNAPPPVGHVFKATETMFELFQDIIGSNLLTKFHVDRKINVASRVRNASPRGGHFHEDRKINVASRPYKEIPRPIGSHVFQANVTICELIQDIIKTNPLTKFHKDRTINENAPPPGGDVFQPTGIIFELIQDINGMNLLTNIPEDRT